MRNSFSVQTRPKVVTASVSSSASCQFLPTSSPNSNSNSYPHRKMVDLRLIRRITSLSGYCCLSDSKFQYSFRTPMGNCADKCGNDVEESTNDVNFSNGNVHLITTKEAWDEKLSEASRIGNIVVVNFSATWCGPCRMIAPMYSEFSEKYTNLTFITIDVDELTEFSSSWDIRATPTFFFLRDGQQIDKLVGANKPELVKKIVAAAESTRLVK